MFLSKPFKQRSQAVQPLDLNYHISCVSWFFSSSCTWSWTENQVMLSRNENWGWKMEEKKKENKKLNIEIENIEICSNFSEDYGLASLHRFLFCTHRQWVAQWHPERNSECLTCCLLFPCKRKYVQPRTWLGRSWVGMHTFPCFCL